MRFNVSSASEDDSSSVGHEGITKATGLPDSLPAYSGDPDGHPAVARKDRSGSGGGPESLAAASSRRSSIAAAIVVGLIAVSVPSLLIVNAVRVLASDWFVRYELELDGFPSDRYGFTRSERIDLALTGLRSIEPGSEGIALLERAALPDGSRAFNDRELRHMADVRRLLGRALNAQLAALALILALALASSRSTRWRSVVPRGLVIGSLGTLGILVVAVPVVLLGFDGLFLRFHEVFFSGETWRFSTKDTLLRLYPEVFWQHAARLASAIVFLQAIAVALFACFWLRGVRPVSQGAA